MDAIAQLKEGLQKGQIDANRLVDLLTTLQRELQAAQQRIAELEKQLAASTTAKVDQPFSMRAEVKRQSAARNPNANARTDAVAQKVDKVASPTHRKTLPDGIARTIANSPHATARLWKMAVRADRLRNLSNSKISMANPGVLGQRVWHRNSRYDCPSGLCRHSPLTKSVHPQFFQNLKLQNHRFTRCSHQLSRHWQNEFEILCTLPANSLVVHTDETGWSLNSVWAFLSEKHACCSLASTKMPTLKVLSIRDVRRSRSDDAAVYANFTQAQSVGPICAQGDQVDPARSDNLNTVGSRIDC